MISQRTMPDCVAATASVSGLGMQHLLVAHVLSLAFASICFGDVNVLTGHTIRNEFDRDGLFTLGS